MGRATPSAWRHRAHASGERTSEISACRRKVERAREREREHQNPSKSNQLSHVTPFSEPATNPLVIRAIGLDRSAAGGQLFPKMEEKRAPCVRRRFRPFCICGNYKSGEWTYLNVNDVHQADETLGYYCGDAYRVTSPFEPEIFISSKVFISDDNSCILCSRKQTREQLVYNRD